MAVNVPKIEMKEEWSGDTEVQVGSLAYVSSALKYIKHAYEDHT